MSRARSEARTLQNLLREIERQIARNQKGPAVVPGRPLGKGRWPVNGSLLADFGQSRAGGELRWDGVLIAAPAGYALSRYVFRGRNAFRLSILAVRAFPVVILSIPLAVTFINLGMFDKVSSLALMHTALTLPTTVLVIGSVFASIPYELEEAAQVFGCTAFQAFRRVVLPLVLPGIAAAALFTFVMSWNEVFAATVLTVQNRTLPAQVLVSLREAPDAYKFAGGFFMLIPSVIFIMIIRKYLFNMWGQSSK